MSMTDDAEKLWKAGYKRYIRLCQALGEDCGMKGVYNHFLCAFKWQQEAHDHSFFTELGADKYAWMDGPHIETLYRAMLARLRDG